MVLIWYGFFVLVFVLDLEGKKQNCVLFSTCIQCLVSSATNVFYFRDVSIIRVTIYQIPEATDIASVSI
jgi:hypothetical protein